MRDSRRFCCLSAALSTRQTTHHSVDHERQKRHDYNEHDDSLRGEHQVEHAVNHFSGVRVVAQTVDVDRVELSENDCADYEQDTDYDDAKHGSCQSGRDSAAFTKRHFFSPQDRLNSGRH